MTSEDFARKLYLFYCGYDLEYIESQHERVVLCKTTIGEEENPTVIADGVCYAVLNPLEFK
jgi:hypothetical protein